MSVNGKVGAVYRWDSNASIAFTNEATTSNATYTRYRITNASKRFFDDSIAVTVKKNGTTITTGFTIEYAGGVIVFTSALLNTDVITVSGNYFTMIQCSTFFDWKLDMDTDIVDVTTFASSGWREFIDGVNTYTVTCDGYWNDGTFFNSLGSRYALVLYVDVAGNDRYEGYIVIKKDSIDLKASEVVSENIDMQGTGVLYYHDI